MYVKVNNNQVETYPYSIGLLRKDYPNTSFPRKMPNDALEQWNVYPVDVQPMPAYDPMTQKVVESETPELINTVWTITKTVVDLTVEEMAVVNEKNKRSIEGERDRRINDLVGATGQSKTMMLMRAVGLVHKKQGVPLNAAEQAKENELLTMMSNVEALDATAQAAITANTPVGDIVW